MSFRSIALTIFWLSIGLLEFCLIGCRRESPARVGSIPESVNQAMRAARPELRQAIMIMCTATQLFDNYGDELQITWRLHILTEEARFKALPGDRPFIGMLITNSNSSVYSRLCAAYCLADSDLNARSLLTNYAASTNLRHRFNAARAIQWLATHTVGEASSWAGLELVKLIENRSLELPFGTYQPTQGYRAEEMDFMDDVLSPMDNIVFTLGYLREKRALPALKTLVERQPGRSDEAVLALAKIGDPSIGSFLLSKFSCGLAHEYGAAFGMLKYKPAVPPLVECLGVETNEYLIKEIFRDLLEIGDPSALPNMERSLKLLEESGSEAKKACARIVMQMREPDPCAMLLTLLDEEKNELERIEIIRDTGRYEDQRAIDKLFSIALTSENTLLRGNAIWTLGKMNDKNALVRLTWLVKTNAPPPTDFDKRAILAGRPPDYSKKEALKTLREITRQDLGDDAEAWSRWLRENH